MTYPIPGVPGAIATATLNDKYMVERVVVKHAGKTTEFTYGDYQDWNNPLNKVDAFYAGKIAESHNGVVVRDLTTVQTETGSVYVVMPVPASVRAAIHAAPDPLPAPVTPAALTASGATPRMPNGHPDLIGQLELCRHELALRESPLRSDAAGGLLTGAESDHGFRVRSAFAVRAESSPVQTRVLGQGPGARQWTNKDDPVMTCQPLGNPRQGPPRRIVQSDKDIIFFYGQYADGGGGNNEFRIIPTDGRKHDEKKAIEATYYGYTVGNWEGDTLVLDSISFVDTTWLARGGFFHSDQMHVIEKLTRKGNQILYEVTVEDPEALAEPWVMTPRILTVSNFPDAGLISERANCEVYEIKDISSQIRH